MTNKRRTLSILAILFGFPILFFLIGIVASKIILIGHPGIGTSFAGVEWAMAAVFGFISSMIIGPLDSFLSRNSKKRDSLAGYIAPFIIAFLFALWQTIQTVKSPPV